MEFITRIWFLILYYYDLCYLLYYIIFYQYLSNDLNQHYQVLVYEVLFISREKLLNYPVDKISKSYSWLRSDDLHQQILNKVQTYHMRVLKSNIYQVKNNNSTVPFYFVKLFGKSNQDLEYEFDCYPYPDEQIIFSSS